jgi:hypothetical protein
MKIILLILILTAMPTDGEIEAMYRQAYEAYSWFDLSTMAVDYNSPIDESYGFYWTYWKVEHDTIDSMDAFLAHLHSVFTGDALAGLLAELSASNPPYREVDGVLYGITADRGTNHFAGKQTHEIVRVSPHEIIYRVSVNIHLHPDSPEWIVGEDNITDIEVSEFRLVREGSSWRFYNFHLVV